jgi:hypothetical protein
MRRLARDRLHNRHVRRGADLAEDGADAIRVANHRRVSAGLTNERQQFRGVLARLEVLIGVEPGAPTDLGAQRLIVDQRLQCGPDLFRSRPASIFLTQASGTSAYTPTLLTMTGLPLVISSDSDAGTTFRDRSPQVQAHVGMVQPRLQLDVRAGPEEAHRRLQSVTSDGGTQLVAVRARHRTNDGVNHPRGQLRPRAQGVDDFVDQLVRVDVPDRDEQHPIRRNPERVARRRRESRAARSPAGGSFSSALRSPRAPAVT